MGWGDPGGYGGGTAIGAPTPNIDRIASEGLIFMDHYGQAGKGIAKFVETFKEYPPSQASLSIQVTGVSDMINSRSIGR